MKSNPMPSPHDPNVDPPRLPVILIVSYNSLDDLRSCLPPLEGLDVQVLDNASPDGTASKVATEFPWVHLLARKSNDGYAAAINDGISAWPERDVLVLNPDIRTDASAVAALAEYAREHPEAGLIGPRLRYPDGTIQESARAFPNPLAMLLRRSPLGRTKWGNQRLSVHLAPSMREDSGPVDQVIGAAMYVRRAAIEDVGGMCSWIFLYGEDVDWCYRMWESGWPVHYTPHIEMTHVYHRLSRKTLDFRSATTRHHWAGITKMYLMHPRLVVGDSHNKISSRSNKRRQATPSAS